MSKGRGIPRAKSGRAAARTLLKGGGKREKKKNPWTLLSASERKEQRNHVFHPSLEAEKIKVRVSTRKSPEGKKKRQACAPGLRNLVAGSNL